MKMKRPSGFWDLLLGRGKVFSITSSVACILFCFLAKCYGQGTMTFTFEGQPRGTVSQGLAFYDEAGMRFTVISPGGLFLVGGGIAGLPDDGTGYLQNPDVFVGGGGLDFYFNPGRNFDLLSFDAAPAAGTSPATIEVIGFKTQGMGMTVTNYFSVSGNFQTFHPDSSFLNVDEVKVLGAPWSLDNLVVGGVPEPSSGALALLGGACAFWFARAGRRHHA